MEETMKPDCHKCEYKGSVAGSAHSCCNHPSNKQVLDNPLIQLMAILGSVGRTPPIQVENLVLNIKGNPHGIRKGWFNYPMNFDPTWLENCDGFKERGSA
jgi:hypothetical protein